MVQWYEVGTKTINVQVELSPSEIVQSWSVTPDKTEVKRGDTINLNVTVYWEAPGSVNFKVGINAFGRTFESQPVTATTSPISFKVPLTVPSDAGAGNQTITVTLYAEV